MGRRLDETISEIKAMGRELTKDVRQTVNEVYSGKGEHASELGTPLNPLQRETYEEKHRSEPEKDPEIEME
jgi:hypothetical protein